MKLEQLEAEASAGVAHHVMLSVVGADRLLETRYFRAKLAQEQIVKAGPVPYTILRTTQCFEDIGRIARSGTELRLPPVLVQPVSADEVAGTLADIAVGAPLNDTVELAGPDVFRLDELVRHVLKANDDPRQLTTDVRARYLGAELDGHSLLPGDDARIGSTHFEDWLGKSTPSSGRHITRGRLTIADEPEGSCNVR